MAKLYQHLGQQKYQLLHRVKALQVSCCPQDDVRLRDADLAHRIGATEESSRLFSLVHYAKILVLRHCDYPPRLPLSSQGAWLGMQVGGKHICNKFIRTHY